MLIIHVKKKKRNKFWMELNKLQQLNNFFFSQTSLQATHVVSEITLKFSRVPTCQGTVACLFLFSNVWQMV